MKNVFKKIAMIAMVGTLALAGFMTSPAQEASAANTLRGVQLNNFSNVHGSISTNENNYSVFVSLEAGRYMIAQKWDWTMRLQRQVYSPATGQPYWQTIDTRTGYVADVSPSNRTFNNIAKKGALMRVQVLYKPRYHGTMTDGWSGWIQGGPDFYRYSYTWIR